MIFNYLTSNELVVFMFLFLTISSCSRSTDYYVDEVNNPPVLKVKGPFDSDFIERKSLDSVKISQEEYTLFFLIEDEEPLNLVDVESSVKSNTDINKISFYPDKEAVAEINLKINDSFLSEDTLRFRLCCFENIPPVAKLRIYNPSDYKTPLQKTLDASASFDRDEKYGGEIKRYRFSIEGFPFQIETAQSTIEHVFASYGSYQIGVEVMDNDSAWSETVFENIIIVR